MSSDVYIKLAKEVTAKAWLSFCKKNDIVYSPYTTSRNTFYQDVVQVSFGDVNWKSLPKSGREIVVGTYWMGDLSAVATVAQTILKTFKGRYTCAPELKPYMR